MLATSLQADERPSAVVLDDDVAELFRLVEPAERGDDVLGDLAGRHRRLADLAGRDLDVLLPAPPSMTSWALRL